MGENINERSILTRLSLVNGKDDCNCTVAGNSDDELEHDQYCSYRMCVEAHREIERLQRSDPSDWAKATAFGIVTRHGGCLQDDVPLDGLIADVAKAIEQARAFGASATPSERRSTHSGTT